MELNDVLNDAAPPPEVVQTTEPVVVEPEAPVVTAAPAETPRAPDGKFAAKETPKEQPRVEMTDKERAFLAAATEERRKRQELEARIKQMEATATPKEPEKQFWDDPDGALRQNNEKVQQAIQQTEQIATGTKLQISEFMARKNYPDFEDKLHEFAQASQEAPFLLQQMIQSPDPAEFVYKTAKSRIELREVGGMEAYREKIRKEERVKLEAELKEKSLESAKTRADIPPSLTEVPGNSGQNRPVWNGPTPLKSILAR